MCRVTIVRVDTVFADPLLSTYRVWFSEEVYDKLIKREVEYLYFEAKDELEAWKMGNEWLSKGSLRY